MHVPLNACQHAYDVGVPLPNGSITAMSIGNIVEARRKPSQGRVMVHNGRSMSNRAWQEQVAASVAATLDAGTHYSSPQAGSSTGMPRPIKPERDVPFHVGR